MLLFKKDNTWDVVKLSLDECCSNGTINENNYENALFLNVSKLKAEAAAPKTCLVNKVFGLFPSGE
jgi:hypothetical protein